MYRLICLIAHLPLAVAHPLGAVLGVLWVLARKKMRQLMISNLRQAGLYSPWMLMRAAADLGRTLIETPLIWQQPIERVNSWVREVRGWEHVETAQAAGKGVLILSPHLGSFELVGQYLATRMPFVVLYQPPRQDWADKLMREGRQRGQTRLATPDLKGVRALLGVLKQGGAAGILPDQVASSGEGVWAPFFGEPAYMPTLPYKLIHSGKSVPLLTFCERLGWLRGYRLWLIPIPELPQDPAEAAPILNRQIEDLIRQHPAQYMWNYAIFRRRRYMPAPPEGSAQ